MNLDWMDASDGQQQTKREPSKFINGRYRFVRELGQGGMGTVSLVRDGLRKGRRLALKRVRTDKVDDDVIKTIQNEFLVLSGLKHPGLAQVFDFGMDAKTQEIFFTAEFVNGVDLIEAAQHYDLGRTQDLAAFLRFIAQPLRALEFIHSRDLVHGDLKPANILAAQHSAPPGSADSVESTVKLIDFGLVRKAEEFGGRRVMGSLKYMAPEVISGAKIDRRTDLYAMGVILYRLVTGRLPFSGKSEVQLLRAHLEADPLDPREYAPWINEDFSAVILQLLEKGPHRRYQSAAEVLAVLDSISPDGIELETQTTKRSYLNFPPIESHQRVVNSLTRSCFSTWQASSRSGEEAGEAISQFQQKHRISLGNGRYVGPPLRPALLIRGPSGTGKSILINHFKSTVQINGGTFISVNCNYAPGDLEGAQPDWETLLAETAAYERVVAESNPTLAASGGRIRKELEVATDGDSADRDMALMKFSRYLCNLSLGRPVVLNITNLQHSGTMLSAFVKYLVRAQLNELVPGAQIMLSATISDDDLPREGPIVELLESPGFRTGTSTLHLEGLDTHDTTQVLELMFPGHDFSSYVVRKLTQASEGSLSLLQRICAHLLDKDQIRRRHDGWSFQGSIEDEELPGQLRSALQQTLACLSPSELRLIISHAYLTEPVPQDLAASYAEFDVEKVEDTLEKLCRLNLLKRVSEGKSNEYQFLYAATREMAYTLVSRKDRPEYHRRAGELVQQFDGFEETEQLKRLAEHFLKSQSLEEAIHFGSLAAQAWLAEFRLEEPIQIYRSMERLAELQGELLPREIRCDYAHLLILAGSYDEARTLIDSILQLSESRAMGLDNVPLWLDLVQIETVTGDFAAAEEWADKARQGIDSTELPRENRLRAKYAYSVARMRHAVGEHAESIKLCKQAERAFGEFESGGLRGQVFLLMAENHFVMGDRKAAIKNVMKALRGFDGAKDYESKGAALYAAAKLYKYRDRFANTRMNLLFSAELRRKMGAKDLQAEALLELGGLDIFLGRLEEGRDALREALRICTVNGNRIARLKASNLIAEAYYYLGDQRESKEMSQSALTEAEELGTPVGRSAALALLARQSLDAGELKEAEDYMRKAYPSMPEEPRARLRVLDFLCTLATYRGDVSSVLENASNGVSIARGDELPLHELLFLESRALVRLRMRDVQQAVDDVEELRNKAEQFDFPLKKARAMLVSARVYTETGELRRAENFFQRAKRLFLAASSKRDLVLLYSFYGEFLVKQDDHAQALWLFEEGLYLAKQLELDFWHTQLTVQKVQLLLASDPDAVQLAGTLLTRATDRAGAAGYKGLLLEIQQMVVTL